MFDWMLFIGMVGIGIPGIVAMAPAELKAAKDNAGAEEMPPVYINILVHTVLVVLFAALGTAFAPRAGLDEPFRHPGQQLLYGAIGGSVCSLLHVAYYYRYFRKRIDMASLAIIEKMRISLGIWPRLLYGGVVEEVIFRWGLMSFFAWLGSLITGSTGPAVYWVAIILSGVLFGLAHLPGAGQLGIKRSPLIVFYSMFWNLWVAIFGGWLFWHEGIIAAILVHMLFHLLWYPFELRNFYTG